MVASVNYCARYVRTGDGWFEGRSSVAGSNDLAMTRHAVVDIAQVLKRKPSKKELCFDRLNEKEFNRMQTILGERGIELQSTDAEKRLQELREMYEPYVFALSEHLLMPLPPWILPKDAIDNWKTSAWGRIQ